MSYLDRDTYGMYKDYSSSGPGPRLMGADTLIGNDVRNHKEEDLGDIKEIMLDVYTGRIAYAVMSSGGFLGIGDKLLAIPWSALTLDTDRKCFLLSVSSETVRNAPGFDKDHWPAMADAAWANELHTYYGSSPYWDSNRENVGTTGVASGTAPRRDHH